MGEHPEVQSLVQNTIQYNQQLSRFNILDNNLENSHSHSLFSDVFWCLYYILVMAVVTLLLLPGQVLVGPM